MSERREAGIRPSSERGPSGPARGDAGRSDRRGAEPESTLRGPERTIMSEPEPGAGTIDPLTKVMSYHASDPIPTYHEMHDQTPVVRTKGVFGTHGVLISRYEDVLWALKHPEVFSSKDVVKVGNEVPLIPLSVDPPDHAQYRRIARPAVLTEEDDRARTRDAQARERGHRRVRRRVVSATSTMSSRPRCRRRSSSR